MKRQATYQPPFNVWRLPSTKTKTKPKRDRKSRSQATEATSSQPHRSAKAQASRLKSTLPIVDGRGAERASGKASPSTPGVGADASAAGGEEDVVLVTSPINKLQVRTNPTNASLDPFGSLSGEQNETLEHIGRWWFYRQPDELSAHRFDAISRYWVDGIWNLARSDETIFTCIIAFATSKMSVLTGVNARQTSLILRGRIMKLVSGRLLKQAEKGPDGFTCVAITCLALLDMRDGDFETALKHLKALQQLVRFEHMTGLDWLSCVWVDLRFALLRGKPPLLPYYIPPEYRMTPNECLQYRGEAHKLAVRNAKLIPESGQLSFNEIFVNFRKIHELGLAWEQLYAGPMPPFGQVYDLEYQILTLLIAQEPNVGGQIHHKDAAESLRDRLIIQTLQLHIWILSRFWIPQKRITYAKVLYRTRALLELFLDDLVDRWRGENSNDMTCLLWICFTFTGLALEFARECEPLGVHHLTIVVRELQIRREADFVRTLQKWPWIERWHAAKALSLWAKISSNLNINAQRWHKVPETEADAAASSYHTPSSTTTPPGSTPPTTTTALTPTSPASYAHYYVGGFEFYAAG